MNVLLEEYTSAFGGSRNAMFRLKENWGMLHQRFDGVEKLWKKLRKTTDLEEYKSLSAVERAQAAYDTGRAENELQLRAYLDAVLEAQEELEAEAAAEMEGRISDLKCLRCDGAMIDHGPFTFKLGEESLFFSDINRLMSGSLTLHLLRCESCGKVEFFAPDK